MRHVSWEDALAFVRSLSLHLSEFPEKVTGVYGLPRGGLCLAVLLSHKMDIPLLMAPCKGAVVIDDISDSGKTLLHYRERNYFIATMFYKKTSQVEPDFWGFEKTDQWVNFPWEIGKEE